MFAYVGCYTAPDRDGRGEGIGVYRVDPASGEWTPIETVGGLGNPSFLTLDKGQGHLYAVHGGEVSEVSAYARDRRTGRLSFLGRQGSGGRNPVHLDIDASGRLLAVANYTAGTVAALPIGDDGTLGPPGAILDQRGDPGPDPIEQASAHPHHIPFDRDRRFLIVPDKGLDRLFVYRADAEQVRLVPHDPPSVATHPGAGPRHIAFHPQGPYAYVINELDSTVTAYGYDTGRGGLHPRQVISTLPEGFAGRNSGAEIVVAPSGRFLYSSNRGHDSIAIFAIDPADGTLSAIGWEPTGGATPRFFALDPAGAFLYAANQGSDTIVAFRVDRERGGLTPTGRIVRTGSPSCICFAAG
jgi:6-phosphogluconolactonase